MTDEEEITRPGLPNNVARPCVHCGKVYGDHAQTAAPQTADVCRGIRAGFWPEAASPGEDR